MFYSKLYLNKEPKIPTLLSLLLIISAVFLTGRLLVTSSIPTRAQKSNVLKTEIINIISNQATVTWISNDSEEGYVIYGSNTNSLTSVAQDVKDTTASRGKYKNHSVKIKNLKPNTRYFLKIVNGDKIVLDSNYKPFEFTTSKEEVLGKTTSNPVKLDLIDFIYPTENAIITASIPLIKGVAIPNSNLTLNLKGANINRNFNIKSDNNGKWSLTNLSKLNPGKYTMQLTGPNKIGIKINKSRSFTIAKGGEQVLGESTPSAITITPEPSPTISPTPIPTIATSTPQPTIPVSGNSAIYMWVASIAFIILGFSLILFASV